MNISRDGLIVTTVENLKFGDALKGKVTGHTLTVTWASPVFPDEVLGNARDIHLYDETDHHTRVVRMRAWDKVTITPA